MFRSHCVLCTKVFEWCTCCVHSKVNYLEWEVPAWDGHEWCTGGTQPSQQHRQAARHGQSSWSYHTKLMSSIWTFDLCELILEFHEYGNADKKNADLSFPYKLK